MFLTLLLFVFALLLLLQLLLNDVDFRDKVSEELGDEDMLAVFDHVHFCGRTNEGQWKRPEHQLAQQSRIERACRWSLPTELL